MWNQGILKRSYIASGYFQVREIWSQCMGKVHVPPRAHSLGGDGFSFIIRLENCILQSATDWDFFCR